MSNHSVECESEMVSENEFGKVAMKQNDFESQEKKLGPVLKVTGEKSQSSKEKTGMM